MAKYRVPTIAAALLVPLLGGCFPRADYTDVADARVISTRATVTSVPVADPTRPTPRERATIAAVLRAAGPAGVRLRVVLPSGTPMPDAETVREITEALGVAPGTARVAVGGWAGPGAEVQVIRVEASAPDCARMITPNVALDASDRPSISLGCATYSNLAAQIVDPADLVQPHVFGGAHGATSTTAVNRYQQDAVKPPPALGVSRIGTSSSDGSSQ